jgi:hypothetical protein
VVSFPLAFLPITPHKDYNPKNMGDTILKEWDKITKGTNRKRVLTLMETHKVKKLESLLICMSDSTYIS